jgi:hypothetical protein
MCSVEDPGELQKACQRAGPDVPRNLKKRNVSLISILENSVDSSSSNNKRPKPNILNDYKCPICHEIPLDPVMAEDGTIYERKEIEEWLADNDRSPVTNQVIGKKVIASSTIRNTIEDLVMKFKFDEEDSDDLKDLVLSWKARQKVKKRMQELLQAAKGGDVAAMDKLSFNYRRGRNGFEKDRLQGDQWDQKAADAGSIRAMARHGIFLLRKKNRRPKERVLGASLLSMAASESGSAYACLKLGMCYAKGKHGFPKHNDQARRLLVLGLSDKCPIRLDASSKNLVREARETLKQFHASADNAR